VFDKPSKRKRGRIKKGPFVINEREKKKKITKTRGEGERASGPAKGSGKTGGRGNTTGEEERLGEKRK